MRLLVVTGTWRPQVNDVVHTPAHVVGELGRAGHEVRVVHPGRCATRQDDGTVRSVGTTACMHGVALDRTGPLRDVDVTAQLHNLDLPLLLVCGEHDEATPEATRSYAALAPRADVIVVEGAAHVANYDRPEEYLSALRGWLRGHDL